MTAREMSDLDIKWTVAAGFADYEVSECGRVRRRTQGGRRYPAGYELTAKPHQRGYLVYILRSGGRDTTMLAHRLVALSWLGAPPSDRHEVAHNDGVRTNNHRSNLRWATPAENQADRKRHGTYVQGENAYSAKLSNSAARAIRQRYADGGSRYVGGAVTMAGLASEHGVSIAQVSRIVNGIQRAAR